ncbi:hypothetical protein GGF46_002783 [Coemansia sp. RSA 552]|nr:hypothetical protein GGF46_002783 [Coemansia sp. RSA 552]
MSEADEELDRAREQSQGRFRSAFEAIFAKYGHIDEDDDIIDLGTGRLVVDNGRMRNAGVIELGDLLHNSKPSSSMSPELGTAARLAGEKRNTGGSSDSESGSDYESFETDTVLHTLSHTRRRQSSSFEYDSSDSLGSGPETPLDAHFTSSIELYLERLRRQLSGPPPDEIEEIDLAEDALPSPQPQWSFRLPSSPHTMTSFGSAASAMSDSGDYISETVSPTPEPNEDGLSEEEPIESFELQRHGAMFGVPAQEEPIYERPANAAPAPAPVSYIQSDSDMRLPRSQTWASGPVIFKPQPVLPQVFFEYGYDDDNASIHSEESAPDDSHHFPHPVYNPYAEAL